MKKTVNLFLYFIFLFAYSALHTEKFKVDNVKIINIAPSIAEGQCCEIGCSDAVAVFFTDAHLFLQGIEIELKQTPELLNFPNSLAYAFYSMVSPAPSESKKNYKAAEFEQDTLPARVSSIFQLPVIDNHNLQQGPYSKLINHLHSAADGPFMFRLIPMMKNLPPDIENAKFILKVKPILNNKGGLKLNFIYQNSPKPINVRINDVQIKELDKLLVLKSGTYHIVVNSDDYRSEVCSCIIEQGRIETMDITLKSIIPMLFVQAPKEVQIFFNDKIVDKESFPIHIMPGKHTIKFKLGNYEIVRSIKAEEGKSYNISFLLDVIIHEE